jgi:hypothetical protein
MDKSIHHCGMNRDKVCVDSIERFSLVVSQFSISSLLFLGKVFPKLYRRTEHRPSVTSTEEDVGETSQVDRTDEEMASPTGDYVFRIVLLADR